MDAKAVWSTLEALDAVILIADESGRIAWASSGAESLLGERAVEDVETVTDLLGADAPTGAALPDPDETVRRRVSPADREIEVTVETVDGPVAGAVYVCRETSGLPDPRERERRLVDRLLETSGAAVFVLSGDGRIERMNDRGEELLGLPREEVLGSVCPALDVRLQREDGTPIPDEEWPGTRAMTREEAAEADGVELVSADGTGRRASIRAVPVGGDRVVVRIEDVSERTENERTLARQRDELRRLNRINKLIRDVNRAVVGETTREGVLSAVCDCLVGGDTYPIAVVTEVSADGEIEIAAAAGIEERQLDTVAEVGDDSVESAVREASRENRTTVLTDVGDGPHSEVLRRTASALGVRAIGNVPLRHEETVEGVLTLGTSDAGGFGERERTVLAELGQIIGTALGALQTRNLLHGEAVIELEFTTGPDACLVHASEVAGVTCRLDGIVPVEDDQYLCYVSLADADVEAVEDATGSHPAVENVRAVEDGVGTLLEIRVSETDPVAVLVDEGALIKSGTFGDGDGRVVVTLARDTGVRDFVERATGRAPELELLAKREVERSVPVGHTAWRELDEILTERQRTVLEAAYFAGYFDWPRRSTTGEELAASLGLASSTLHQHLRVAERKVFEFYFERTR